MTCRTIVRPRVHHTTVRTNPQGFPGVRGATGPAGPDSTTTDIETDVSVSTGQSVYVKGNGHLALSKADANGTKRCQALVEIGAAPTFAATIRSHGVLEIADWTAVTGSASLTPNAPYYVSAATAGALTTTAPSSGWITRIGTALSTTKMDINPEPPIKL